MSTAKRVLAGCLLLPLLLIAGCCGKMYLDAKRYELPGQVLKSPTKPTQSLDSAWQVAESLDVYVQPRFAILRDMNFGMLRIVYREHAGIAQLKVDTPQEKELIANVNAANRDYAINLLHCAPKPGRDVYSVTPRLQLLYFNQQKVVRNEDRYIHSVDKQVAEKHGFDIEAAEEKAIAALPQLRAGREYRTEGTSWDLLMRPVLAAKPECLSCHSDTKPGATLGVMVYAVRKIRNNTSAAVGKADRVTYR